MFYKNLLSNHAYFSYIAVSHCKNHIMKFRKLLKQWLGYSRRERAGSMVLLLILVMVLVVRTIRTNDKVLGDEASTSAIAVSDKEVLSSNGVDLTRSNGVDLKSMPIYSGKGEIETPSQTERIWNPDKGTGKEGSHATVSHSDPSVHPVGYAQDDIDINRADSATLEGLPGIGPVLSVRIIKYRYLLGYFYRIDQLNDVYGLDEEVIEMNRHRFTCDSTMVRKININTAAYPDLLRHPYINRSQVEAIITYRRLSGSFTDISELIRNRIFNSDELIWLEPYLELK